ncbi:MAG TPA: ABC transporter permease [Jiangellaceae bacterium]|nr:ABC transporter permease [Jiangellaceae bacterium]
MALVGAVHAATLSQDCLARNDWICVEYVRTRADRIVDALQEHLFITVTSLLVGFLVAFALALLARHWRALSGPVQGVSTVLYTIPSLALFALLFTVTGISATTVVIGLILYSLTILVRGIIVGLDSVPADVRESAVGMGYGPAKLLWRVELPLGIPAIFAALRVAAVSTVALTTVGFIVGHGGLGNLIFQGLRTNFKAEVLTAAVLCVVLALVADVILVGAERLLTPWRQQVVA